MLDQKDKIFLTYLRNNARINLTTVSRKTSIPISTLYDRLKAGERSVILKHTSLLNFQKIGFGCRANIILKVDRNSKENLREFLTKSWCVNSLCKINNGYDFMVETVFHNIQELEEFIETLDSRFKVLTKQIYYILEDITRENFMTSEATVGDN